MLEVYDLALKSSSVWAGGLLLLFLWGFFFCLFGFLFVFLVVVVVFLVFFFCWLFVFVFQLVTHSFNPP